MFRRHRTVRQKKKKGIAKNGNIEIVMQSVYLKTMNCSCSFEFE